MLFFACMTPEKWSRKTSLKICGWSLRPVFDWERNTPSRQSLPVRQVLFSHYCLHIGLFTWVWKDKQIYTHTYIHTFRKKIM